MAENHDPLSLQWISVRQCCFLVVLHIIGGAVGLCCPLTGHHCLVSLGASVPLPSKREVDLGHLALILATCPSGI